MSQQHIYSIFRNIPKDTHPKLSDRQTDSQTKQTNEGTDLLMDRDVVVLTKEMTDEQRDSKTKTKQDRHADYTAHADIQIYYNERALTALKRYTSIAQAGHLDIFCMLIKYESG